MTWEQACQGKTNLHPSPILNSGTLLYVEGKRGISLSQALGLVIGSMRHVHKSLWYMVPLVKNKSYTIRRILRGAMDSAFIYDDEYSAIYAPSVREEFLELQNVAIASGDVKQIVAEDNNRENINMEEVPSPVNYEDL